MSISAGDVKKLRDMTGAGMMDAKKALSEVVKNEENFCESNIPNIRFLILFPILNKK